MFISYYYIGSGTLLRIVINDSDFQEIINPNIYFIHSKIIDVYEKRNLNVSKNFALFLNFYMKNSIHSINEMFDYIKSNCIKYSKYEIEIQKYLMLL